MDYEEIAEEVFREQNEVRRNPQSYIEKLQNSLKYYKDNILYKENEIPIETAEGVEAVQDAINFLKNQNPVQELIYSRDIGLSCKDIVDDIGPKGIVSHEGTEIKNIYNRLEQYCDWDGAIAENIDFGFRLPENIIMNMIIDDGDENRYQRQNLFYPHFKYVGVSVGPHRDFGYCAVIEYAYNIRETGTDYLNVDDYIKNFRQLYKNNGNYNEEKPRNPFQETDDDAPDNTISLRVEKEEKEIEGQTYKITKKIFSLDDESQHIVEFREKAEKERINGYKN